MRARCPDSSVGEAELKIPVSGQFDSVSGHQDSSSVVQSGGTGSGLLIHYVTGSESVRRSQI